MNELLRRSPEAAPGRRCAQVNTSFLEGPCGPKKKSPEGHGLQGFLNVEVKQQITLKAGPAPGSGPWTAVRH
jgi:hypothetical protein